MARGRKAIWVDDFLELVKAGHSDTTAARLLGISPSTPEKRAKEHEDFREAWTRARAEIDKGNLVVAEEIALEHARKGSVYHFEFWMNMKLHRQYVQWKAEIREANPERHSVEVVGDSAVRFSDLLWDAENGGFRKGGKKGKK